MELFYGADNHVLAQEKKVIRLSDYRRKLDAAAAGYEPVSFHWESDPAVWSQPEIPAPKAPAACAGVAAAPAAEARRGADSPAARLLARITGPHSLRDLLELASSAAVLALAVTVWVQFLH